MAGLIRQSEVPGASADPVRLAEASLAEIPDTLSPIDLLLDHYGDCKRRVEQMVVAAQVYHDAVVLAAEQVQDKRLDLLEDSRKGAKEIAWGWFAAEVLLVYILESPIAGLLVGKILQKAADKIRNFRGESGKSGLLERYLKKMHDVKKQMDPIKEDITKLENFIARHDHVRPQIKQQLSKLQEDLKRLVSDAERLSRKRIRASQRDTSVAEKIADVLAAKRVQGINKHYGGSASQHGVAALKAGKAGIFDKRESLKNEMHDRLSRLSAISKLDTTGVSFRIQAQNEIHKIQSFAKDITAVLDHVMWKSMSEVDPDLQNAFVGEAIGTLLEIGETLDPLNESLDWQVYKRDAQLKIELAMWAHIFFATYVLPSPFAEMPPFGRPVDPEAGLSDFVKRSFEELVAGFRHLPAERPSDALYDYLHSRFVVNNRDDVVTAIRSLHSELGPRYSPSGKSLDFQGKQFLVWVRIVDAKIKFDKAKGLLGYVDPVAVLVDQESTKE